MDVVILSTKTSLAEPEYPVNGGYNDDVFLYLH